MAVRTRAQVIAFRVALAEARKIREKVRRSGLSQQESCSGPHWSSRFL